MNTTNTKKQYAIMRFEKAKDGAKIGRVGRHNFRTGKPSAGVDTSRSDLNEYIGVQSVKELHAGVKSAIATATRKPRPDASKMVEFFCGASPEFFQDKTHDEAKAYLHDCVDWARETFGHENVIGAQLHFDEATPHCHIEIVPMADTVKKTKHTETNQRTLNSAHWMDGKKKMEDLQTSFAAFVQARGHKLERGEPKAERLAMGGNVKHKPVRQWHDEQIAEAKNATSVAEEILTNAAREEKRAADVRRDAERAKAKHEYERGLHAVQALAISLRQKKDSRMLDSSANRELQKADERKAELDKRDAELKAKARDLDELTGGLGLAPAGQKLTTWQGPSHDEQRILDFLAQRPEIAELVNLAQQNPALCDVLEETKRELSSPGMRPVDNEPDMLDQLRESGQSTTHSHSRGYGY